MSESFEPGWMEKEAKSVMREVGNRPNWIGPISQVDVTSYPRDSQPENVFEPGWMERQAASVRREVAKRPYWVGHINDLNQGYRKNLFQS